MLIFIHYFIVKKVISTNKGQSDHKIYKSFKMIYNNSLDNEQEDELNDNFDFLQIFKALKRNKNILFKAAIISIFLGLIYSLSQKRVWQGEFQIVLSKQKQNGLMDSLSQIGNLSSGNILRSLSLDNAGNSLTTEVEILKSPSILMSVFEYVKSKDLKNNDNWRYADWLRSNLSIKLEKGTSVLNLAYRDENKDIILPVLNKISKEYQLYSGRERDRNLKQGIKYLNNQINIYKEKSKKSQRAAQTFAIEQDLTPLKKIDKGDDEIRNIINVERLRVDAANQIRLISEQIILVENLDPQSDEIIFLASRTSSTAFDNLISTLKDYNVELISAKKYFLKKDIKIKQLESNIKVIKNELRNKLLSYLRSQKDFFVAKELSAQRPKGVLLQYKDLLRESLRDEKTLSSLETELKILSLEEARNTQPWELITSPTLLKDPVGPSRKITLAGFLFLGITIGIIIVIIKEIKSDLVYDESFLKNSFENSDFFQIQKNNIDGSMEEIYLLSKKILQDNESKNIDLLNVGDYEYEITNLISNKLNTLLNKSVSCKEINKVSDLRKTSKVILILKIGATQKNQFFKIKRDLLIANKDLLAIVLIT